jgi:hypothetical protein
MVMRAMGSIGAGLARILRGAGHLAAWTAYQAAEAHEPSRPPARLIYHGSSSKPAHLRAAGHASA